MANQITTLDLLKQASNEDLSPLVDYIEKASISELLTVDEKYKRHHPNHKAYVNEIFKELRSFGGNTFANILRGFEGPSYSEILVDVANKVGAKETKNLTDLEIEQKIIECILRKAAKKAEDDNDDTLRKKLYEEGLNSKDYSAFISGGALAGLVTAAIYREIIGNASILVAEVISQQLLKRGLIVGAGFLSESLAAVLTGPIGWVIGGMWAAIDIAGPAYRVTVPCTLHIAMLRQNYISQKNSEILNGAFDE